MSQGQNAEHGDERATGPDSRLIAVFIAVLVALLAISEAGGKAAQTAALLHNGDAMNLWQSFQTKTIRQTNLRTASDLMDMDAVDAMPATLVETRRRRVQTWREAIARFESEPETQEGRKELMVRARTQEALRDRAMAANRLFGLASTAFLVAIVLASATIVTRAVWLAYAGGAASAAGIVLGGFAWLAPGAIQL